MSDAMLGALFGFGVAVLNYSVTQWMARKLEADKTASSGAKSARFIRKVALVDLVLFPLVGYLIWPVVLA